MILTDTIAGEVQDVGQESEMSSKDAAAVQPWFTIFNPYFGPRQTATYPFIPFPAREFPRNSPFEDCVIIAHAGIEPCAAAAGFPAVDEYLKHLIRQAATGAA